MKNQKEVSVAGNITLFIFIGDIYLCFFLLHFANFYVFLFYILLLIFIE